MLSGGARARTVCVQVKQVGLDERGKVHPPPSSLPYKVDTSRPFLRTNWTSAARWRRAWSSRAPRWTPRRCRQRRARRRARRARRLWSRVAFGRAGPTRSTFCPTSRAAGSGRVRWARARGRRACYAPRRGSGRRAGRRAIYPTCRRSTSLRGPRGAVLHRCFRLDAPRGVCLLSAPAVPRPPLPPGAEEGAGDAGRRGAGSSTASCTRRGCCRPSSCTRTRPPHGAPRAAA